MKQKVLTSIRTSANGYNSLHLIIISRFDLGHGFQLWPVCSLDRGLYQHYVFDFARRPEVRDSGLGWLLMFCRRAERTGRLVEIVNLQPELALRWTTVSAQIPTVPAVTARNRDRFDHGVSIAAAPAFA